VVSKPEGKKREFVDKFEKKTQIYKAQNTNAITKPFINVRKGVRVVSVAVMSTD